MLVLFLNSLMEKLTGDDFSNDKFKFATSKYIKIDSKKMKIRRIEEYKISKENSSNFNTSIIAIDKRKETIN